MFDDAKKEAGKLGNKAEKETKEAVDMFGRARQDIALGASVVAEEAKKLAEKTAKDAEKTRNEVAKKNKKRTA